MPVESDADPATGFINVAFSGHISREELRDWTMQVLRSPASMIARVTLTDLTDIVSLEADPAWVASHANMLAKRLSANPHFLAEIILAPDDQTYGYSRMYQSFVSERYHVEVCRTREEADQQVAEYLKQAASNPPEPI